MARIFMKGTEAIAEAAVRAGCRFFAGYPITPQNEIPEYLARRLPEVGGVFVQGESEVASINMVYGAGALVLTVAMYFYLTRSKQGYEIAVVGESERTARYVGIKVGKVIVRTMMLSGAVCGLAGLLLVSGTDHTITTTIADGRGFTAVMVAWLAKFNPFSMIFTSFLLVFLDRGASEISTIYSLNHSFGDILTGIILFFIIGSEFFISYKLNFLKNNRMEEK